MFFKERINPQGLRITLETLINIRWIAIVGQFFTVSVVEYFLNFEFPYFGTLTLIFLSALVNVYLEINKSKFLTINNFYATLSIFYDLVQLILLLFMTGGLSNPFSIFNYRANHNISDLFVERKQPIYCDLFNYIFNSDCLLSHAFTLSGE
jgi:hypothetical protein